MNLTAKTVRPLHAGAEYGNYNRASEAATESRSLPGEQIAGEPNRGGTAAVHQ